MKKNNEVTVTSRTPTQPVEELEKEISYIRPSADVFETPEAYTIVIEMPGVARESVQVRLEGNSLLVRGLAAPLHGPSATVLFSELRRSGYFRSFNLGDGVDRSNIDARHEDGVLSLKLVKKEELRPKEITIQ